MFGGKPSAFLEPISLNVLCLAAMVCLRGLFRALHGANIVCPGHSVSLSGLSVSANILCLQAPGFCRWRGAGVAGILRVWGIGALGVAGVGMSGSTEVRLGRGFDWNTYINKLTDKEGR
ncbi:MAG: hypothetical protein AAF493_04445 [Pseudomonadota bacterium]